MTLAERPAPPEHAGEHVPSAEEAARSEGDPLWFKDAIIYETHVRAFADSDADGVGDFRGFTSKLDYLADLGITAIWLLPFYPSPLKDDGYDIADYTSVNPDYGTLRDVRVLIREAHRRGLRVITELVCNHTSDQHPWFQRARRAPRGSGAREFYVWSDTPDRYQDARIIFKDFERSNWTWDPVAEQYYWHRFYHHQPDLNFDNPRVQQAVIRAMEFWLDMGVDGLRLDAVPYLYEREGTNCENLPETHAFLKKLRAHIDSRYRDRMLLAEANQWPEDSVQYFGDGDECHMAFHFPVMPRMFMAIRMEDRFPIYDILGQTPPIPDNAQWALFLRNHDELTLEMVTDEERDYMYRVYANDPQMRINLGIRRRLAPLLNNNRRRIELMNGLLFSLPGTPVIYYGDEIGMGDNVYLGDRNGVRTPMQWSGDRNAGFSEANRQALYFPVITDPEYHFEAVNVEVQQANPQSLLWWMKRLIALRRQHPAFGRGSLQFLHPDNRKVLAFIRQLGDEQILVVANLSRFSQPCELDLSSLAGMTPVEMFGRVEFPPIGELPYFLTLSPHGFYWFQLRAPRSSEEVASAERPVPTIRVEGDEWQAVLRGRAAHALTAALPDWIRARRWFRSKAREIRSVHLRDATEIPLRGRDLLLLLADVEYVDGDPETYTLPLAFASGEDGEEVVRDHPSFVIARLDGSPRVPPGILYDAVVDPDVTDALVEAIGARRRFRAGRGEITASPTRLFRQLRGTEPQLAATITRTEQTNSSVVLGDRLILKLFRRLEEGINPDLEVSRFLTDRAFPNVPAVAGWVAYRVPDRDPSALAILQEYIPNQGDLWNHTLDQIDDFLERAAATAAPPGPIDTSVPALLAAAAEDPPAAARTMVDTFLDTAWLLGRRTGELHRALSSDPDDPAFSPEPYAPLDQRSLYQSLRNGARQTFLLLSRRLGAISEAARPEARRILESEAAVEERYRSLLGARLTGRRIRVHGDYHAGQVLWTGRDVVIIDFEGEPARPLSERRRKRSALVDVAGMIRSFHYAAYGSLIGPAQEPAAVRPGDPAVLEPWLAFWYLHVSAAFLRGYREAAGDGLFMPRDEREFARLLEAFLLEKAIYELAYELNNRPDWISIPIRGISELLSS